MHPLEDKPPSEEVDAPGQTLAIWAESLYLCNLLLAPGICFALLLWLYLKQRDTVPSLAQCHLKQAVSGSLWAALLLGAVTVIVIVLSDYKSEATWVVVITYFVCFHTTLVMLGVVGLAKAMAGQKYVYPLIGRPCDDTSHGPDLRMYPPSGGRAAELQIACVKRPHGAICALHRIPRDAAKSADQGRAKYNPQRVRLLTQSGFFMLFLLAPVFDLFRLDLNLGHFFFLGMNWTLGMEDFMAHRISAFDLGINIIVRGGLPILSFIATGVWLSWRFGRLYCGWLCPHFSVVETINQLMRHTIGRQSLWDQHPQPERNADGSLTKSNPWYWLLLLPLVIIFAFTWAVALLTYLLPPAEIYGNLWHGTLTRNQTVFLSAATSAFFIEFMFARHLFCRFGCAIGYFQSLAWMGNRKALIVGFDRRRAERCADCNAACDNICPMRIKPRSIKRHMFTCTQCTQCINACTQIQAGNPEGTLLKWVQKECALDKSVRDFGHHIDIPDHCFGGNKTKEKSSIKPPRTQSPPQ